MRVAWAIVLIVAAGSAWAGSLEPSGTPAPTMKTLDQIPGTWSQEIPVADRFVLVFGGVGVLDRETGLVWEQSPSGAAIQDTAAQACVVSQRGGHFGWRLPNIHELMTLIEFGAPDPPLPPGHPFSNIQVGTYWSSTLRTAQGTAYAGLFEFGGAATTGSLTFNHNYWCVRGPAGAARGY